jgi:hypothetical protein
MCIMGVQSRVPKCDNVTCRYNADNQLEILRVGIPGSGMLNLKRYDHGMPKELTTSEIIVNDTNMKVGSYGINEQPDVCRGLTVTRTVVVGDDTPGYLTIVGKDYLGAAITEDIIVGADSVAVKSTLCYSTIDSITGVDWVISGAGDEDTICINGNDMYGLQYIETDADNILFCALGICFVPTISLGSDISECFIDLAPYAALSSVPLILFRMM